MNKNRVYGGIASRKPLLSKKNSALRLKFSTEHLDEPVAVWKKVLWTDETGI